MGTITAANSVYMLAVTGLFPVPQLLQGYAADDAFSTDAVTPAEVVMGVDGRMSAGYVPYTTQQTIMLMPDSPSILLFDAWLAAQKAAGEVFRADAVISLPSIGQSYVMTFGILTSITPIAGVKKVLQSRSFTITWEGVSAVPI
jgi:hypothetical protein